ncbi:NAD+ synthase [bacterium]|nr:NAD+ synthase [bacterium]
MDGKVNIEAAEIEGKLTAFIKNKLKGAKLKGAVIGLSGGLDSSVTAFLAVKAIGKSNVIGINMPYKLSNPGSLTDARNVAEVLGIDFFIEEITSIADMYFVENPEISDIRRGNFLARIRMALLYDYSAKYCSMVVGSSNKTERLLGYTTIWGDMACGIAPLGDLYKTQVRQLARYMGVPENIIKKAPSADLWPDQTDEAEMGITYEIADQILYLLFDKGLSPEEVVEKGFPKDKVALIVDTHRKNAFKCRMPDFPEV